MKVNREELVNCLDKVWPAVGRNALVPKYQTFVFYGTHVQATGGALWIDSALPEGVELCGCVEAEPLYNLLRGMNHKEVDISIEEEEMIVKAPRVNSKFTVCDPEPTPVPEVKESISLENLHDLVDGLNFCKFGVSHDEALGVMCGVRVRRDLLWSCDRYRVLEWKMNVPVNLECSMPIRFLERFVAVSGQVVAMQYEGTSTEGGCLSVRLSDGTVMWGKTLTGEYMDVSAFFPPDEGSENIQLDSTFPEVMERHLTFLKDVPAVDKEVVFEVRDIDCRTYGEKKSVGKKLERFLDETTPLVKSRGDSPGFQFLINPALLKDVMGLCWEFKYFPGSTVVLFQTEKFRYLVQTRG